MSEACVHVAARAPTPGHPEAVGQYPAPGGRSGGAAGDVWTRGELCHHTGVALPLGVVGYHLENRQSGGETSTV